jgi:phage repressor protein C with HTH and peptisase S24 domain
MKSLGERVRERRAELGISQQELARKAGNISYQAIQQIEAGGKSKYIVQIASALGVSAEWLEKGVAQEGHNPRVSVIEQLTNDTSNGPLRVLGMAEGGPDGWSLWNGSVVQYIERPDNLRGVADAYAVYVTGSSMEPRYHPGELAHIHPHKPVTPGCYVLVQKKPTGPGEAPLAVIKRLVKRSGNRIILEQTSPAKTFEIKADEVVSMHRVVGSREA